MSTYRYAAYGSNLHPRRLQKRVPSATWLGTSSIAGYELRFNKKSDIDGSGKCSINRGDGIAYFAIFEIATSEKRDLDRCEGLGKGYREMTIQDSIFGKCVTYIANPAVIDETLRPMSWYKEMVLLGCRLNRFPGQYVRQIENTPSIEDPDDERARDNWKIVQELRDAMQKVAPPDNMVVRMDGR